MLYGQLGITEAIMNGTADEKAMLNYFNRTIEPILESIIESMERVFGASVGSANERFKYFRDPFKLVSLTDIAQIADTFTRNEILTANEIRGYMGIPPATDPKADKLTNSNMPQTIEPDSNQTLGQPAEPIEPPLDPLAQKLLDMKGNIDA